MRLEQQYPDSNKGRGVTAVRLQEELVGDVRLTLYLLWGVVGVVLLCMTASPTWAQGSPDPNPGNLTLTGGIDLSVGSLMGLVGVVCGLLLQAEQHWVVAVGAGLLTGAAAGATGVRSGRPA